MKKFNLFILTLFISNVYSQNISNKYAETITSEELKSLLYVYASDSFEGREAGTKGEILAVEFIRDFYLKNDIKPAKGTEDYFQKMEITTPQRISLPDKIPDSVRTFMQNGDMEKLRNYAMVAGVRTGGEKLNSINVASIIEGSQYPNEYIVITAHLDHVGIEGEDIFNGADDDGSGSMALLEIAQAFKMASLDGYRPKRSIVILHVSAEEKGLLGSEYYTDNPLYPLEDTITNLNVDMIGRTDPTRDSDNDNYIYLIGTDRLSSMLHETSERVNKNTVDLELDYRFNAWDDPNRFYERSDHYNFAKNNIPVIFYFSGTHEDYHGPGDTPDKIRYDLLTKRTKLIFHTAWEIANMDDKIVVD
ncbi:MAG: M28 family peptidase [Methylophilaceae bacterium]